MCEISNEIKFCTCKSESYEELKNAWTIFRRKKGWLRVGQTVFNENDLKIDQIEIKSLEHKLNSQDLFDFEYSPIEEDKLKIKLTYKGKCSEYDFKYLNNTWEIYKEDQMDWMEDLLQDKPLYFEDFSGKIEKPFK